MSSSQIDQPNVSIGGSGFEFKGKRRAKSKRNASWQPKPTYSRLDLPSPRPYKILQTSDYYVGTKFIKEILPKFDSDQKRANEGNVWCVMCRKRLLSG